MSMSNYDSNPHTQKKHLPINPGPEVSNYFKGGSFLGRCLATIFLAFDFTIYLAYIHAMFLIYISFLMVCFHFPHMLLFVKCKLNCTTFDHPDFP